MLLSNRKIYWFGSNGTIDKIKYPILLDIQKKVTIIIFSSKNFLGISLHHCVLKLLGADRCL